MMKKFSDYVYFETAVLNDLTELFITFFGGRLFQLCSARWYLLSSYN